MATTQRPKDVATQDVSVEQLLKQAEKSRTRVSRVLEYVRGERDADGVPVKDWFAAIEYVAEETGEDLVLYGEHEYDGAYDEAKIYAVDDRFGRLIAAGWTEYAGTISGPEFVNRDDVEETFRFASAGERPYEVFKLEDAKDHLQAFAAENGGGR